MPLLLLALIILSGCCEKVANNPQIYPLILPDEVIECAPEPWLIDYARFGCVMERVRGEKPSKDCKEAFPGGY
jgi:hypothetical protein